MTDKTIDLDRHRGMAAQKATDIRRLLAEVAANEKALRSRQDELETQLIAAPATNAPSAISDARRLRRGLREPMNSGKSGAVMAPTGGA